MTKTFFGKKQIVSFLWENLRFRLNKLITINYFLRSDEEALICMYSSNPIFCQVWCSRFNVFFFLQKEKTHVKSKYAQNPKSMLQYKYESVYFVCRKPLSNDVISNDSGYVSWRIVWQKEVLKAGNLTRVTLLWRCVLPFRLPLILIIIWKTSKNL